MNNEKLYGKEYYKKSYNWFNDNFTYNLKAKLSMRNYLNDIKLEGKIFEYGCGIGQNIYLLPNAIGYDISNFALDFCEKKGIKVIHNIEEIKNNSIDVAFSIGCLEHDENPLEQLQTIYSKLKWGGKFVLVLPKEEHNCTGIYHLYSWNLSAINNLVKRVGFKIIRNECVKICGETKLSFLAKVNFNFYHFLTKFFGLFRKSTKIKLVAIKEKK